MSLLVLLGDSHTGGAGASPGNSWPEQLQRLLARPDLALLNLAVSGAPLAEQVERFATDAAPALDAAAPDVRLVFAMGGYNDIAKRAAGTPEILATYAEASRLARARGARFVAGLDVIRRDHFDGKQNAIVRAVNAALRADPDRICDAVIDFASRAEFDRADGPYPSPPFAADEVHLDDAGQRLMAGLARPVIAALLPPAAAP